MATPARSGCNRRAHTSRCAHRPTGRTATMGATWGKGATPGRRDGKARAGSRPADGASDGRQRSQAGRACPCPRTWARLAARHLDGRGPRPAGRSGDRRGPQAPAAEPARRPEEGRAPELAAGDAGAGKADPGHAVEESPNRQARRHVGIRTGHLKPRRISAVLDRHQQTGAPCERKLPKMHASRCREYRLRFKIRGCAKETAKDPRTVSRRTWPVLLRRRARP